MTYLTSKIRDLSMALKVLSRIKKLRPQFDGVRSLLNVAIEQEKEQQLKDAKPTTNPNDLTQETIS